MDRFNFEFLKQVAIFTLKNDLNASSEQIEAFDAAFNSNVNMIGSQMIEATKKAQRDYIQKAPACCDYN